jgi:serine/threonine protein kinase
MTPDHTPTPDERITPLLVACDEALAAGTSAAIGEVSAALPQELRPRLQRNLACLQLLREVLPRREPAQAPASPPAATSLDRFQLRSKLGQGAHGVVWLAFDPTLGREIALKVPQATVLEDPELRQRFLREARAAAGLDHPNIVPVHEAGAVGAVCYIASAYCPGPTLAQWLRQQNEPVPFRDAATLVATMAEAVQHAHHNGVVHRDLKPANVLLARGGQANGVRGASDGDQPSAGQRTPLAHLVPRITDFGLAKLPGQEDTGRTRTGAIVGTPQYMAPEQACGRSDVAAAADVYALGVVLYELLTGRPPMQGDSVLDLLEQVRSQEPVPPRRLRPSLPRDLETICLKCLEKEPRKRYATARALAEDLERFLAGEPIRARPVRVWERALKWARRRPAIAGLLALVVAITVLGFALVFHQWLQTAEAHRKTLAALGRAEANLYLHRLARAEHYLAANNLLRAEQLLDECPTELRHWEWHYLKRLCHSELLVCRGSSDISFCVAFSPDGRYLASASSGGGLDGQTG